MADYTLSPDDQGVYELQLPAGTEKTIALTMAGKPTVMAVHHTGDTPVYLGIDRAATPANPAMRMLVPGSWLELNLGAHTTRTLHLITTADAVVSVART